MPERVDLADAYEKIVLAVEAILNEAVIRDGPLDGVVNIVRGDRQRGAPEAPSIWVFPETATPDNEIRTMAETWRLPLTLVAIWKDDEPERGMLEASKLAARARTTILRERSLGTELRGFVQDVRSGPFQPAAPYHSKGSLHSAAATLVVRFTTCEL